MSSCRSGHGLRHWFTVYGSPGLRTPVCVRGCGTPNPKPLNDREWDELLAYRDRFGRMFVTGLEDAITAEQQRRVTAARKVRDILAEIREQGA
jgi:hypothetical protein